MQIRLILAAAGTVAAVAACGSDTSSSPSSSSSAASGSNSVAIKSFSFSPASVTVAKGTTVTWTNNDPTAHTTTADKASATTWDSKNIDSGKTYAVTFNEAGTYSYHCNIHDYMKGTITVTG